MFQVLFFPILCPGDHSTSAQKFSLVTFTGLECSTTTGPTLVQLAIRGHMNCFQPFAITNNAAGMNCGDRSFGIMAPVFWGWIGSEIH